MIAIWSRVKGPQHPDVARAYSALGELLSEQGLHAEARTNYSRALAIRERALGPTSPDVARTLQMLADTLAQLGQQSEATELSARALRIWEEVGSESGLGEALVSDGDIATLRGDYITARESFERALRLRLPMVGPDHPSMATIDAGLAKVAAMSGDANEAMERSLRAETVGRDHLRLILQYLPEREGLGYAKSRPAGLALALSVGGTGSMAPAFDALVRGRSLTLDELVFRRRAAARAESPDIKALWDALGSARQRLANLATRDPGDGRTGQYVTLLREARRERERAERALAERSVAFRDELRREEIGFDEVRGRLQAGDALVSFVYYDRLPLSPPPARDAGNPAAVAPVPSYAAFVMVSGQTEPALLQLGPASRIDGLIAAWRRRMVADVTDPVNTDATGPSLLALGTTLRRAVWDPLAPRIGNARRVFIVPDNTLNLVPLAALPTAGGRYLVESGPVLHYLSAERDLVVETSSAPIGARLLTVGGPAFTDRSTFSQLVRNGNTDGLALRGPTEPCPTLRSIRFVDLPGSQREAQAVARIWTSLGEANGSRASVDVLTGADATERTVKRLSPGSSVLHIATHGFFLTDNCEPAASGTRGVGGLVKRAGQSTTRSRPGARASHSAVENPLLLSGLALAGANRRGAATADEEDGILTAEEVAGLDLEGIQWAVLSACETGVGTIAAGEGVLGLRRAFQVAGARAVIMSLWSVEDQVTRRWMEALYRARFGEHLDTPNAVRAATLNLIRQRRSSGLSTNPVYWAGFVASGDWR